MGIEKRKTREVSLVSERQEKPGHLVELREHGVPQTDTGSKGPAPIGPGKIVCCLR